MNEMIKSFQPKKDMIYCNVLGRDVDEVVHGGLQNRGLRGVINGGSDDSEHYQRSRVWNTYKYIKSLYTDEQRMRCVDMPLK